MGLWSDITGYFDGSTVATNNNTTPLPTYPPSNTEYVPTVAKDGIDAVLAYNKQQLTNDINTPIFVPPPAPLSPSDALKKITDPFGDFFKSLGDFFKNSLTLIIILAGSALLLYAYMKGKK